MNVYETDIGRIMSIATVVKIKKLFLNELWMKLPDPFRENQWWMNLISLILASVGFKSFIDCFVSASETPRHLGSDWESFFEKKYFFKALFYVWPATN